MAGVYHHIEEYDDKMPAPTDDLEVYQNTKFSQQWDKKIEQTITVLDHCAIITDKVLTAEERKPCSLQFPAVAKTPVERPAKSVVDIGAETAGTGGAPHHNDEGDGGVAARVSNHQEANGGRNAQAERAQAVLGRQCYGWGVHTPLRPGQSERW